MELTTLEKMFLLSLFDDLESCGNLTKHQMDMINKITAKIEHQLDGSK